MQASRPKKHQKTGPSKIEPNNNNGTIQIRFAINGHRYQFNPIHRGKWGNDLDMAKARQICQQIELDLSIGKFDCTLDKYRPIKIVKPQQHQQVDDRQTSKLNCLELYLKYLTNNKPEREKYNKGIGQVKRCLSKVDPSLYELGQSWEMLAELKKHYKTATLLLAFKELRCCINWHIQRGLKTENFYANICQELERENQANKPARTKTKQAATSSEIAVIISAFENNEYSSPSAPKDNRSYYANFVAFLFATGCRPEDARAVEWGDIFEKKSGKSFIRFNKAYTETGCLKTTKNQTTRLFPINPQLAAILQKQKQQNTAYQLENHKLIFPSKKGKYLDGVNFQQRQFKPVIEGLLKDGKISKYITTGNGRHSFITQMRSKGLPDATIGALVETSTKMIESHYCDKDGLIADLELPEI